MEPGAAPPKQSKSYKPDSAKNSTKFEDTREAATMDDIQEHAWKIYMYFVASGSAYEVCTSPRRIKVKFETRHVKFSD